MDLNSSTKAQADDSNDLLQRVKEAQRNADAWSQNPWKVRWLKKKDPELVKAVSRISSRLVELQVYLGRRPAVANPPRQAILSILQRITADLDRDEAKESAQAPKQPSLREPGRDAAWDAAEDLKIALLYVAPDEHLSSLLEAEATRPAQHSDGWRTLYSEAELKELRKQWEDVRSKGEAMPPAWREIVIDRLATLYQQRMDRWRHDRANLQLRANYFFGVTVVLGVVLGFTGVLTVSRDNAVLLMTAMVSGALGSVLSGIYKLRDEMMNIHQLRSFWPVLTAMPFVGAAAGTLLLAVLTSGLIKVADLAPTAFAWQHYAVFGFLAGFSEPFFLGVVKRVAGMTEEEKKAPAEAGLAQAAPASVAGPVSRPAA